MISYHKLGFSCIKIHSLLNSIFNIDFPQLGRFSKDIRSVRRFIQSHKRGQLSQVYKFLKSMIIINAQQVEKAYLIVNKSKKLWECAYKMIIDQKLLTKSKNVLR